MLFALDRREDTGGLAVSYLPAPDFKGRATQMGVAARVSFGDYDGPPPRPRSAASARHGSLRYEGFVTIPEDGQYSFFVTSDQEARVYLDGRLLVQSEGRRPTPTVEATRALEAGPHRLKVDCNRIGEGSRLAVEWAVKGNRAEPIPPRLLHSTETGAAGARVSARRPLAGTLTLFGLAFGLAWWLARSSARAPVSPLPSNRWQPEDALLFIVVAGQAVPVLLTGFFPSTDGASHLDGAGSLLRMLKEEGWLTRKYYEFNSLQPNWTSHIILAALQEIVPAQLAERIVVGSYAVLLPVSCRYAIAGFNAGGTWAAILATPFTFHWLLAMGFYNFCLGVPLMFVLIGYWLRHGSSAAVKPVAVMAGLSVIAFFTHPLPLLMAVGMIFCFLSSGIAADLGRARRDGHSATPAWLRTRRRIGVAVAGLSPALLLLGHFLLTRGPSLGEPGRASALWDYMRNLTVLVSIDEAEATPAALVFWLFAIATAVGLAMKVSARIRSRWDLWLVAAAGTAVMYFLLPDSRFSGQFVTPRLLVFSFLFTAVWLGSIPFPPWLRRSIVFGIAVLVMWMSMLRAVGYAWFAPMLAEYVSVADHLTPNSTLLTLSYRPTDLAESTYGKRIRPFVHAGGYLSDIAGVLALTNYEGDFRYFPLRFRDDVNPYVHLAIGGSLERIPPCVDIDAFNTRTRERVDYVMTWGLDRLRHGDACTANLSRQLAAGYDRIYRTEPLGLGALYRRRDFRRYDEAAGRMVP